MPNFDGTGPSGKSPMTVCCRGCCVLPLSTKQQELDALRNHAKVLQIQLQHIGTGNDQTETTRENDSSFKNDGSRRSGKKFKVASENGYYTVIRNTGGHELELVKNQEMTLRKQMKHVEHRIAQIVQKEVQKEVSR